MIAFSLFGFDVHWYGILYVVAFASAWYLLPRLQTYREISLSENDILYVLSWGIAGVLLGGRLGYVFLYEPIFFLRNPGEIFAIWNGGMSMHGGLVGVGLALYYVARELKIDVLQLADVVVVPAALGMALGRVGNFTNNELYVSVIANWLVVVGYVLIAGVCYRVLRTPSPLVWLKALPIREGEKSVGVVLGMFLFLAGLLRFISEFYRVQEFTGAGVLTRGQLYSIPVFLAGIYLLRRRR